LPSTKRKTPENNVFRGSLVDKRFEISNLDFVRDLEEIINYLPEL